MSTSKAESVRVTRRFSASRERLFDAWVDATLLQRWLAPIAESDARAGGRFRLEVSKPEGSHVVTGEYREFVPGQRLVMSWCYEGPMASAGAVEALLTVEFIKDGLNSEIRLHHERLTNPVYFDTIRQGAWAKALEQLQQVVSEPPK